MTTVVSTPAARMDSSTRLARSRLTRSVSSLDDDVVDAALLWFREEDGDLTDALVDAITPLADQGVVWLLTPKPGREGHVEPEDIAEAAQTAGLRQTSTISAGENWQGTRLVPPRAKR